MTLELIEYVSSMWCCMFSFKPRWYDKIYNFIYTLIRHTDHHRKTKNSLIHKIEKISLNWAEDSACRLCFTKLKLLLLAIEIKGEGGSDSKISINPRGAKIAANTQGFFIAQSADEVKRWVIYRSYKYISGHSERMPQVEASEKVNRE